MTECLAVHCRVCICCFHTWQSVLCTSELLTTLWRYCRLTTHTSSACRRLLRSSSTASVIEQWSLICFITSLIFWCDCYQFLLSLCEVTRVVLSPAFSILCCQPTALSCCKPRGWLRQQRRTGPNAYCQPPAHLFFNAQAVTISRCQQWPQIIDDSGEPHWQPKW